MVQRYLKYKKENPTLFKEIKSWQLFTQTFGTISGVYVEQIEFDSFAEYEKCQTKLLKDKEFSKIEQEAMALIDTTTFSMNAWKPVTY